MQHAALKLLTFFDHLFFNGYFSYIIVNVRMIFWFHLKGEWGEKYLVNKTPKQC